MYTKQETRQASDQTQQAVLTHKLCVSLSVSCSLFLSLSLSLFLSCHKHRTAPRAWPNLGPVVPMGPLGLPIKTKESCKFSSGPPAEGPGGGRPHRLGSPPPWGPAGGIDWGRDTLKDYTKPRQTIQRPPKDYTKTWNIRQIFKILDKAPRDYTKPRNSRRRHEISNKSSNQNMPTYNVKCQILKATYINTKGSTINKGYYRGPYKAIILPCSPVVHPLGRICGAPLGV